MALSLTSPSWVTPTPNPSPRRAGSAPSARRGGGRRTPLAFRDSLPVMLLVSVWCLVLLGSTAAFAQKFPTLIGRIVDEANLLSAEDRAALEQDLKALEAKSTDQLVVYTTRSLQGYPI